MQMPDGPMNQAASNKILRVALWLAGLGTLAILWSALCTVPGIAWNPPRLAPSYALAEGLNIYATRASGAQLGWFYGPVFALWGLPAAWVPQITLSFEVWAWLNYFAIFFPVWLVLREVAGSWRPALQGLVLYAVLLLSNVITQSLVFVIHVDGLCVSLGTLACWSLHRAAAGRGRACLHVAALAVVLAIWTKQVAVSLVPAIFLWSVWTRQVRLMRPFFFWLVAYGAIITAGFLAWFDEDAILFYVWLFHLKNPLRGGWLYLGGEVWRMGWTAGVWLVGAALPVLVRRSRGAAGPAPDNSLNKLLISVALCHLPLGLAAALKVGGGLNSVHSLNYLLLLLALWLMWLLPSSRVAEENPTGGGAPAVGLAAVIVLGLGVAFSNVLRQDVAWVPYRGQEKLLTTARANPGRIYFPWNPLLTLITDRRIYPFDDALYCLDKAGLAPPGEAVRAAVPPRAVVYYEEPVQSHFALNYFPDYHAGRRSPRQSSR
jgi:hypothetical protein